MKFAREFIDLHIDPEAESRRRNNVEYCRGFTAKDLKEYILKRFAEEKLQQVTMSEATISRLFNPPKKNYNSASYYKGIFDVNKCGGIFSLKAIINIIGMNKIADLHDDDRFAKAQVKYLISYLSSFEQDSLLISMDDKAKVKIGIPCISHHVKSRKYFVKGTEPETSDHDFPLANGLLIVPSGFLCYYFF